MERVSRKCPFTASSSPRIQNHTVELTASSWIKTSERGCFCTGCYAPKPWILRVYMHSKGDWTSLQSKNPLKVAQCTTELQMVGCIRGRGTYTWALYHRHPTPFDHCQKLITSLDRPLAWHGMMLPLFAITHSSCRIMSFLFSLVYLIGMTCKHRGTKILPLFSRVWHSTPTPSPLHWGSSHIFVLPSASLSASQPFCHVLKEFYPSPVCPELTQDLAATEVKHCSDHQQTYDCREREGRNNWVAPGRHIFLPTGGWDSSQGVGGKVPPG